jgi:hypothetical protein
MAFNLELEAEADYVCNPFDLFVLVSCLSKTQRQ